MFAKLLFCFIVIPFVELVLLIQLGQRIGLWPTIWMQIFISFVGASLAKVQGFRVWLDIHVELSRGQFPADRMLDGLLIFIAGILLLTPGVLTDCVGLLLLFPWTRIWFRAVLKNKIKKTFYHRPPAVNVTYEVEGEEKKNGELLW